MAREESGLLSIGDLCAGTGLSADVVRIWERRYGFPLPVRLPSGHRRYRAEDLTRLRLMAEAVSVGHKPSKVVRSSEADLCRLLQPKDNPRVSALYQSVTAMDMTRMRWMLGESLERLGIKGTLEQVVAPLLGRLGLARAEGSIGIPHLHLVTEALEDFLRQLRRACPTVRSRQPILLCTLPGESQRLGLLMSALTFALQGFQTELLGLELPVEGIVEAARILKARQISVFISIQSAGEGTRKLLLSLKEQLPEGCQLTVSGQGARRTRKISGVERLREAEQV